MRKRTRGYGAVVGLAALALAVAACGGSSTAKPGTSPTGTTAGFQGLNPGTGTPKKGGTLNMLGQGDVDFMDPNISYYTIGGLAQRMWIRGLYAYAAIPGKTTLPSPDLATAAPTVSNGGKTYAVTIRTGAMWDTSPARQVTAADALLGLKRACNPVQPFGGLPDFETLIVGYQAFCTSFAKLGSSATVAQIKSFINSNQISGVTVSGQTITYTLVHPASYFGTMLTLDPFNPAPVESLNYIPASAASQQHPIADGPYTVQSYTPTRTIVFVRNPAWKASSDPIRKAYVDKIVVTETGNEPSAQQQLQTNTAAAGMEFDAFPPVSADAVRRVQPGVAQQRRSAGQGRRPPGDQLRHQPVAPDRGRWRVRGEPAAHPHHPAGHQRVPGPAVRLRPVPAQPEQGQVPAGLGRIQERAEPDPAVPADEHDRDEDGADAPV